MEQKRRAGMLLVGALWAAFYIAAHALSRALLPRGSSIGAALVGGLPILLAMWTATWWLRRRGESLEARGEMLWPNENREGRAPIREHETRAAPALFWIPAAVCALLVNVAIILYFWTPPNQPETRTAFLRLGLFCILITAPALTAMSFPLLRLDAHGISGVGFLGRRIAWRDIASCRVESQRNAWGARTGPTVILTSNEGHKLSTSNLRAIEPSQQREFLLALHRALQPEAPEPDLAQVLEDGAGAAST